jgi:malate synthase
MPLDRPAPLLSPVVLRHVAGADHVLTAEALAFLSALQARFGLRLHALMVARARRQERIDRGELPDYLPHTREIRQGIWQAAPVPSALEDRRVEITGPVERKMMINALNSGARVFMADFEDATAPSFANIIAGHANLIDYRDGTLEHQANGKSYRLGPDPALLIVRPRGLHMAEGNVLIAGNPVSAALFDFGLSLFHCGRALAATGRGPFYYLPKLESHAEARFWNDVFLFAQDRMGIAPGTIKATVLIETLPAAFEMDEIVWELRDHIAGLPPLPDHLARDRRGDLYRSLVGHHRDHRIVLAQHVAGLHQPFGDLGLGNAFADVGHSDCVESHLSPPRPVDAKPRPPVRGRGNSSIHAYADRACPSR